MKSKQNISPTFLPTTYRDLDLSSCCLFTGTTLPKHKGEHVIPRWLQREYDLSHRGIEMGMTSRLASVMQFRAPADPEANRLFGQVEEKIKLGSATMDEIHLWSKKLSVGMIWNHYRLAMNASHPHAPTMFDPRLLRIVLMDFHREFAQYKAGDYRRTGSTLVLPSKIKGFWLAHAFGAVVDPRYSETHDAIAPFSLMGLNRDGKLVVSALYDTDRTMESGRLIKEWESTGLHACTDDLRIRAGLAAVFFEEVVGTAFSELYAREAPIELLHLVGYQLGIVIEPHNGTLGYRKRTTADKIPIGLAMSR